VILAHHEDDQAETIFQRLLRGSGVTGLTGMSYDSHIGALRVLRPLLDVRASELRAFLREHNINWREDASNRSGAYQRNQVRVLLQKFPALSEASLDLGSRARVLTNWLQANSPELSEEFGVNDVQKLPPPLARESLRRWLAKQGSDEISPDAIERFLQMCLDAATPARQHFPGGIFIRRRRGTIACQI
jgi:tRNA(Ile)-lysidine synthase